MAKTLSESAAEILKASMASAGKEPSQHVPAQVVDLGGETPTTGPTDIGAKAAAAAKEAPKPGKTGAPAEPMKKLAGAGNAEVVADSEDDESGVKKEEVETTEEEIVAEASPGKTDLPMPMPVKKAKDGKVVKEEEEVVAEGKGKEDEKEKDDDEDEEDDEDEKAMKEAWKKDMVKKHKGSMKEDVDALFNGESLSEDFRVKATLIFEAAVTSRVEQILEDIAAENDSLLTEAYEEIKTELTEQVDEYLNYVVEQWVEQNEVAIESGLRAELTEDFINGLKNLFAEHYIEIPDDKIDVANELANKVVELEMAAASKDEAIAGLTEEVNKVKKEKAVVRACEGLTAVQAEKMKSLAESVEFTAEGDFDNKLATIRENYFPSKVSVTSEVKVIQETTVAEEPEVAQVQGIMAHYVKAITKTAPKA